MNNLSMSDLINRIVPITRFNRGEAKNIFEEVLQDGPKLVMRNNAPICVLISPEDYTALLENQRTGDEGKDQKEKE